MLPQKQQQQQQQRGKKSITQISRRPTAVELSLRRHWQGSTCHGDARLAMCRQVSEGWKSGAALLQMTKIPKWQAISCRSRQDISGCKTSCQLPSAATVVAIHGFGMRRGLVSVCESDMRQSWQQYRASHHGGSVGGRDGIYGEKTMFVPRWHSILHKNIIQFQQPSTEMTRRNICFNLQNFCRCIDWQLITSYWKIMLFSCAHMTISD